MIAHSTTRALCVIETGAGIALLHWLRFFCHMTRWRGIDELRWVLDPKRLGRRGWSRLLAAVSVFAKLARHSHEKKKPCICASGLLDRVLYGRR